MTSNARPTACFLGALRAPHQTCSHKEASCVTVDHFYWSGNALLPVLSNPSSEPTSHEYHSGSCLIFRSRCWCGHVRQDWGGKRGGVSPRKRVTTPVCDHMCVWGWKRERGGEGCYLSCRAAHRIRSLSCQTQLELSVALGWARSEWLNGMPGGDARWGVTDDNRHLSVDGDPLCPYHCFPGRFRAPGVSTTTIMGCNLCSLQKREEHYRLLYEIAQVSTGTAGSGIDRCVLSFIIHAGREAVLVRRLAESVLGQRW